MKLFLSGCMLTMMLMVLLGAHTVFASDKFGGGSSGSGSSSGGSSNSNFTTSRSAAVSSANGYNNMSSSLGRNYSYSAVTTYSSTNGWGYSVQRNAPYRSDSSENGYNRPTTNTPSVSSACYNQNLITAEIFFVPTGTQPVTASRSRYAPGTIFAPNPYQNAIVRSNQLEVGVTYDPIVQIRNTGSCLMGMVFPDASIYGSTGRFGQRLSQLLFPVAHAGGGITSSMFRQIIPATPNGYPLNIRTQLPFGSGGSFPIRARIDIGNNGTVEWERYLNTIGPVARGRVIYQRLPAFSTNELGSHSISVITDIRHSVDAGRGCYATSTPASIGWGCIRETNEQDNDRTSTFATVPSTTSLRLAVDASDITVGTGQSIDAIPFVVTNNGNAIIRDYRYRVTIAGAQYASSTRTTSLTPGSQEIVRSTGSYTTPNTPTTLALRVCAQVATSTQVCDDARIIVAVPQCSDARDNDGDSLSDAGDPGCYTDPSDPTRYDPNDDSESDTGTLTPPTITLSARPDVVRYDDRATLEYSVTASYPITCMLTGGRDSQSVTHTPPSTNGTFITQPLQSTITFTLTCTPNVVGVVGTPTTVTETVQVIPLAQET